MTDLLKMLLDDHEGSATQALHLYNKGIRRLKGKSKFQKGSAVIGADEVSAILERRLIRELDKMNLAELDQYQKVKTAIEEWRPRLQPKAQAALQACGLIQNILLSLLPQLLKKQRLLLVCQQYKEHLQQVIDKEEQALAAVRGESQAKPAPTDRSMSDLTQIVHSPCLPKTPLPESLQIATQKYHAVTDMQKTLQTSRPVYRQLQDFENSFSKHQQAIKKSRDSMTMIFLKGVITILSGGLAVILGLWRSQGDKTARDIHQSLRQSLGG